MTEIKTTTAWGPKVKRSGLVSVTPMRARPKGTLVPVVVVHGLSEAEVHEAAALLEKSREVCKHKKITHDGPYQFRAFGGDCNNDHYSWNDPNECPSCGRKVKISQ